MKLLTSLARALVRPDFVQSLREAPTAEAVVALVDGVVHPPVSTAPPAPAPQKTPPPENRPPNSPEQDLPATDYPPPPHPATTPTLLPKA